jgi:putative transposase
MPKGLIRIHAGGNLHFITTSCYRREPLLGSARARDVFVEIFEQVRKSYGCEVIGFVVMPEHIHILISEPKRKTIPIVMQVLKQRVALRLLRKRRSSSQREIWEPIRQHFWQPRSYDFNVYSDGKVTEKLLYMHRNPVQRGLVSSPELWRWSSYRAFAFGEEGVVKLNWQPERKKRKANPNREGGAPDALAAHPSKIAKDGAPTFSVDQRKPK